jgi:hypothetical protein
MIIFYFIFFSDEEVDMQLFRRFFLVDNVGFIPTTGNNTYCLFVLSLN